MFLHFVYDQLGLKIASQVSDLTQLKPSEIWAPGKERKRVEARSLLCYWAVRDLDNQYGRIGKMIKAVLVIRPSLIEIWQP